MPAAPLPPDEDARLQSLRNLRILDTSPDAEFDAIARAASLACGTPIALVSLVDADRQWFKANVGLLGVQETGRELAFCAHAIHDDTLMEVPDATLDARFADNALVTGRPDIRFYAGAPLRLEDGSRVGTLCVIDRQPRHLEPEQRELLMYLAQAAAAALEGHRARAAERETTRALHLTAARLANVIAASQLATFEWDIETDALEVNDRWPEILGYTHAELAPLTMQKRHDLTHPDDLPATLAALRRHLDGASPFCQSEYRLRHRDGHWVWVQSLSTVMSRDADGKPERMAGTLKDNSERRQQEEALRKSEEFLERTGRLAQVGGWDIDLRTSEVFWTAETYRIIGLPPDYRPTLDAGIEHYAPEARPLIRDAIARCAAGGPGWDLEVPFIRPDGERIWVRVIGNAILEDGKPIRLSGAFQDITARVRQTQALRAADERAKLATDSGRIGIWDWDIVNNVQTWDPTMHHLYGIEPREEPGTYETWSRHLHPQDKAATEQAVRTAIDGGAPYDAEFRVLWQDGSLHHMRGAGRVIRDSTGRAVRMVGVNWDVTQERRAAELALQMERQTEATERESAVFANSPDILLIVRIDAREHRPTFRYEAVSPALSLITGWGPEEWIGQRPQDCLPPAAAAAIMAEYENCLSLNRTVAYTTTLTTPNGLRDFDGSLTPIRNPQTGTIVRLAETMRDVTERNRLQTAAIQGQKMEAIGRLASGVAHDFNNILQSITGSFEIVQDDVPKESRAHEFAAIGLRSAKRGSYLTHHLLSYARQQLLRPRVIDVPALLSDIEKLLGRTLGPSIAITVRADAVARYVRVDPGQMQTALLNLAINAAHAMPKGGTLRIESRLLVNNEGRWVCVAVTDSGTGMDQATLARALEPFFTTKGVNGTGLGLPMVQGFVEQSNGRFHIASALGRGTTITMHLPAAMELEPVEHPRANARQNSGGTVLLVDDDPDVLVTTGAFLEIGGFTVARVTGGNEALALLANGARFDAMVTDFAMPGMNGGDLIEEVRRIQHGLPAVLISGFTDLSEVQKLAEDVRVLHKPFERRELIGLLHELLGKHGSAATAPSGAHRG